MRFGRPVRAGFVVAILLASSVAVPSVAAGDATLRIEPATIGAPKDGSFSVKVVHDAAQAISGAQATIVFDPSILQIVSVKPGPGYAGAPILLPTDMAADIRTANQTGRLAQVAAAHTPPDSVPAGKADFLVVRFQVVGCGETDLALPKGGPFDAQMISGQPDGYGRPVTLVTVGGHVTTCVGAGAVTPDLPLDAVAVTSAVAPVGLIGAALAIVVGSLAGWTWRSRRSRSNDDAARARPMRRGPTST